MKGVYKVRNIHYFETALYLFVGLIAFSVPLFTRFEDGAREWGYIYREWRQLLPYLFIFLVNNFILIPKLLFKSKFLFYIVSCIILLFSTVFVSNHLFSSGFPERMEPRKEMRVGEKPHHPFDSDKPFLQKKGGGSKPFPHRNRPLFPRTLFSFGVFIVGFLIIGFNSGVKFFVYWMDEQEARKEKERHHLSTELAFLKQQISPHFFMNTLNNIHALVDIDSGEAQNAIIKLSKMMRYLLYDTNIERISLAKEIEFLTSYIDLMRLRYDESSLIVMTEYPENRQNIFIPSLLFLPLVENAFKHGVENGKKSFISIELSLQDKILKLIVRNSNFGKTREAMDDASGIGLENIRKRLELIYRTDYTLQINSQEEIYEVHLEIPV